jgi:pilus assembly protein Flp/PilA
VGAGERPDRSGKLGSLDMYSSIFETFAKDESGATAIEYALIAAIISVAIVASLSNVGTALQGLFNSVVSGFQSAGN